MIAFLHGYSGPVEVTSQQGEIVSVPNILAAGRILTYTTISYIPIRWKKNNKRKTITQLKNNTIKTLIYSTLIHIFKTLFELVMNF